MRLAKQTSGYFYSKATGARLWQGNYHERVLRNVEATEDAIAYMLANPIDAGLAASAGDYPFWGSGKYSRQELVTMVGDLADLKVCPTIEEQRPVKVGQAFRPANRGR
jgi:hypothetical protein